MRNVRNVAVAGAGVYFGYMAGGMIAGMVPKGSNDTTNVWVDRAIRFGVAGATVILALRLLGAKGKK